jgi:exonuclease SbcD
VVAGSFQALMKGAAGGNPDDYLSIVLLDEAPVIQAIQRLRTVYPKTMEISYQYQQTALALSPAQRPGRSSRSALELFDSFAEWSTQKPLTPPQREIMAKLLTDAAGDGGGE